MQAKCVVCVCVCMFINEMCLCVTCAHTPRLGIVLQGLQPCLDQIQRLEEQRRAGATQRATHKGFESWVSLGAMKSELLTGSVGGSQTEKWGEEKRNKGLITVLSKEQGSVIHTNI